MSVRRQSYHSQTRRGSFAKAWGVARSSGLYCFQRPSAPRKVGMPLSAEMPAPVRTTTEEAARIQCRACSTIESSHNVSSRRDEGWAAFLCGRWSAETRQTSHSGHSLCAPLSVGRCFLPHAAPKTGLQLESSHCRLPFLAHDSIQAPGAGAGGEQEQEDEAVQHRQFAAIGDRPKAFGIVPLEISDGHFSGYKKCNRTGPQPQGYEDTASGFEETGQPQQRVEVRRPAAQPSKISEQFLESV